MPRALLLCSTIVAVFQLQLAAETLPVEDAPVPGSVIAVATELGMEPPFDRARFMSELIRLLYMPRDGSPSASRRSGGWHLVSAGTEQDMRVPVPLAAAVWSKTIFRRPLSADYLVAAILSDRRAALICRGLSALDDDTLRYFARHPALLTALYERGAAVFSAFSGALRIVDERVVPVGGAVATPLWEAVVRQPVTQPERFARTLFGEFEGRLAYLYDAVAGADPGVANFVLGEWIDARPVRVHRFKMLAEACVRGYREWHLEEYPFARPLNDFAMLLLRVRTNADGRPEFPAARAFWADVFEMRGEASAAQDDRLELVDAAWLVEATGGADMYARAERLDQLAFGQRVFAAMQDAPVATLVNVIRMFPRYRMLMLTLERMGIRDPALYRTAIHQAAGATGADPAHRFWTLAQIQGAVAVLARMRQNGTLSAPAAGSLVSSLAAVPIDASGSYRGAVARWIRTELARSLPAEATWEARVIEALSGPEAIGPVPTFVWEGQRYRVDLRFAERRRLQIVREKQGGPSLDLGLELQELAHALEQPSLELDELRQTLGRLDALEPRALRALRYDGPRPPGGLASRDALESLRAARDELAKLARPADVRRAARVGASLTALADTFLGETLISLAYAADLGDSDGSALLGENVALRHDFNAGRRDSEGRARAAWALPRQHFVPGAPWHVTGSLLGLDLALAPLALRRLTIDQIGPAPRLSSLERDNLAVDVGLLNPSKLTDGGRDAIVAAIARGTEKADRAVSSPAAFIEAADEVSLDGWRRREIAWHASRRDGPLSEWFSLAELLILGGGATGTDLDGWGTSAFYSSACICSRFPSTRLRIVLSGRAQLPMISTALVDVHLRAAVLMHELRVPALLTRSVLVTGLQEFIDFALPVDASDWWAMVRAARDIDRRRFEDYVAATAMVDGPLVPVEEGDSFRER